MSPGAPPPWPRHSARLVAAAAPTPRGGPRRLASSGIGRQARGHLRTLCRAAGRLISDHGLITAMDRVLCALSGGKDSAALLDVLLWLQARAPVSFSIAAVVVAPGFEGFDAEAVAAFAASRGVATYIVDADIQATLEHLGWTSAPCAMCSRLRRGVLMRVASDLGYNRLALGHHADDAIETALMNMLFNGQIRALAPRLEPAGMPLSVIRPLLRCFEADVVAYAEARDLPIVRSACPLGDASATSERVTIKRLIRDLAAQHPRIRGSLLSSLGNVSAEALMDRRLTTRRGSP